MTNANGSNITNFYKQVQREGNLRTPAHAERWATAVLQTLGVTLDGRTKKQLVRALPQELATPLSRIFWLLRFQNNRLTGHEFLNQISRRSGNSDPQFARTPTLAVFAGMKRLIDARTSERVAASLAPEVRELWQRA